MLVLNRRKAEKRRSSVFEWVW